jgi:hypothetical protein
MTIFKIVELGGHGHRGGMSRHVLDIANLLPRSAHTHFLGGSRFFALFLLPKVGLPDAGSALDASDLLGPSWSAARRNSVHE